jgi:hypothetical protein
VGAGPPPMTIYATYFDSNFLTRGLACLESLVTRSATTPRILVLALDAECSNALAHLWPVIGRGSELEIVTLDALERAHSALSATKATRSNVEYYFTLTPFLCAEALARTDEEEYAVYIDADLFFFSDPDIALQAADGANIGLVEHRFPQSQKHCAELYGRFNVGWIAFRSAPETQACIARWQQQCLASSVDRPEAGVYGDQKYLDAWPAQLKSLKVVDHPGINLAQWNFARHRLARGNDNEIKVDGSDVIFFHFTQLRRRGASLYEAYFTEYGPFNDLLCSEIYSPYLMALDRIESSISEKRGWRPPGKLLRKPLYKRDRWLIFWPWRALRLFFHQRIIFRHGRLLSSWQSLPYA